MQLALKKLALFRTLFRMLSVMAGKPLKKFFILLATLAYIGNLMYSCNSRVTKLSDFF